jgi:preprotein translocase subunit SecF
VVAIFFFGGAVLRDFALAMIMGVLVGTYSSVFVASPIVYAFRKGTKRVAVKKEKVAELAAQKQKKEEKKTTGGKKKKK